MTGIRIVTESEECRNIWERMIPPEYITDLWEVRSCFQQHFRHSLYFITAEKNGQTHGFLPLSRISETDCYGYFPGETWKGITWLEQNRVFVQNSLCLKDLLNCCDLPFHIRYLRGENLLPLCESGNDPVFRTDEIGYLFHPHHYNCDMENYFREFSRKSLKQILRDVSAIEEKGIAFRFDDSADFDLMVEMNLSRFGDYSYFHDTRFLEGFRSLMCFLREMGWLRFTTVLVQGKPAAVDMACLYKNVLTVFAGGTDAEFPGIAKLINLHHLRRACAEGIQELDFLCGDFHWKKMFHLTPRTLYLLSNLTLKTGAHTDPGTAKTRAVPEPVLIDENIAQQTGQSLMAELHA